MANEGGKDSGVDHEVARVRKTLATMVRLRGLALQDLDRRTGHQRGYFSQILTGRLALRYKHVAEVLQALEIDRNLFFRLVYPNETDLAKAGEVFHLIGEPEGPAPRPRRPSARGKPARSNPKQPKKPKRS
jgi:hypothetical protein